MPKWETACKLSALLQGLRDRGAPAADGQAAAADRHAESSSATPVTRELLIDF